MLLLTVEQN